MIPLSSNPAEQSAVNIARLHRWRSSLRRIGRCAVFALLVLWLPLAQAHKVNMFTYVEGDRVFVEGYFSDGKKAMNSKIEVFNDAGKKLVEGETNEKGQFDFPIPERGDLRITLTASMGHKTEYTLPASEVGGEQSAPDGNGAAGGTARDMTSTEDTAGSPAASESASPSLRQQELQRTVEKAVGKAIMPIVRELSELKERRGFSDIIGGIGFIVGLLGAAFYFNARKLAKAASSPGGEKSS